MWLFDGIVFWFGFGIGWVIVVEFVYGEFVDGFGWYVVCVVIEIVYVRE